MQPPRNIAARAGRWSARHRRIAVLGWIAFVVAAFMVGGRIGTERITAEQSAVGESGKAGRIVDKAFPETVGEAVLVSSRALGADAPAFQRTVADVSDRLRATPGVAEVVDPYTTGGTGGISADRHTAMVSFDIDGDGDSVAVGKIVDETLRETKAAQRAHPDLRVEQFGDVSSEEAFNEIFERDMKKAGSLSLPLTLLILLITFGTVIAAGIPLLLAVTAVVATMGLVGPLSHLSPVEDSINHVILLIGLAVGVDYALFYLRRAREERAAGRSADAALEAAAATSGRAVLISGLTVMTAMAGMYLAGAPTFTSFATGTITVVAVAMIGSLTVLPAVMSALGDRVDRGSIPGLRRVKRGVARLNIWSHIVDRVMRRPLLSATLATAVLVALAIPATQLHTGTPALEESLPQDEPVVQTFNRVRAAFPAETSGLTVVVRADDVTAPAVTRGIADLERAAAKDPKLFPRRGADVEISPGGTVAKVTMEIAGDGSDHASNGALDVARDDLVPSTIGAVPGVEVDVGGPTAEERDFNDTMTANLPYVFGFVMVAAFLLLLVTFRSIVVPIKAIVLNLLSVLAAYGMLVLVFQHGWFKSVLGFSQTGPITAWLPLFLFVVLFGLSMDYHVFILSRVREAVDSGMRTDDAVPYAIKSTAGVVTSAAIVMVAVFAIFGSLSFMVFKQLGVGLAFAVLLDATLIRGVLLPASMKLLGERNWWLPRSLRWIPAIKHEGAPGPSAA
jgi:RND superfamily putative drug exporter